jgi:glutamate N-acetyltransferase/amino-acid N-acetyltransferase
MIQPGMSPTGARPALRSLHATMLCFLTTDAAIGAKALQTALNEAVAKSFNRITVDGDMSTNDTVLVLANGRAGQSRCSPASPIAGFSGRAGPRHAGAGQKNCARWRRRFALCHRARHGAKTEADADAAARAVANSTLVKTSWCGGDPNWGRILCALGYSSAQTVVEAGVDVGYSLPGSGKILYSLQWGRPTNVSFKALCQITTAPEFDLHINLHQGKARAWIYSGDLTEAYVDFNKGDVNDPSFGRVIRLPNPVRKADVVYRL